MQRSVVAAIATVIVLSSTIPAARAQALRYEDGGAPQMVMVSQPPRVQGNLGGFIEFLFGNQTSRSAPPRTYYSRPEPAAARAYPRGTGR